MAWILPCSDLRAANQPLCWNNRLERIVISTNDGESFVYWKKPSLNRFRKLGPRCKVSGSGKIFQKLAIYGNFFSGDGATSIIGLIVQAKGEYLAKGFLKVVLLSQIKEIPSLEYVQSVVCDVPSNVLKHTLLAHMWHYFYNTLLCNDFTLI